MRLSSQGEKGEKRACLLTPLEPNDMGADGPGNVVILCTLAYPPAALSLTYTVTINHVLTDLVQMLNHAPLHLAQFKQWCSLIDLAV
jgi:hypothetical protein